MMGVQFSGVKSPAVHLSLSSTGLTSVFSNICSPEVSDNSLLLSISIYLHNDHDLGSGKVAWILRGFPSVPWMHDTQSSEGTFA